MPTTYNLLILALFLMLAGLGAAYLLQAGASQSPVPQTSEFAAPLVQKNLGGKTLQIPQQWLFAPTQSNGPDVEFLDLRLLVRFQPDAEIAQIGLRFMPLARARPSATLLDSVYALHFAPEQLSAPPGLIGKPLRAEDGFQNETVWYDPVAPNPFVAKCIDLQSATTAPACLRTVKISQQLALTYQFAPAQLKNWRVFDQVMKPYLEKIGALAN